MWDLHENTVKRWITLFVVVSALAFVPQLVFDSTVHSLTFSIASICLLFWIAEIFPPFVPTLFLWASIPLFIGRSDPTLTVQTVLGWPADPVVALFFGGFVLGVAAERTGLAKRLMDAALRQAGSGYRALLLVVMAVTAVLSMWMSNIAAAALVLACLHPLLARADKDEIPRRMILVGLAIGADIGGIATPIGTGPNAIAIAAISKQIEISFVAWMALALPLTIGTLAGSYILLARRIPATAAASVASADEYRSGVEAASSGSASRFAILLGFVILCWLTEPFHGAPASVVSLAAAFAVFAFGFLKKEDLKKIDWSTLLLIMGGITLGRLLEYSGLVKHLSSQISFHGLDPVIILFILCFTSAVLSALMSNTATVILLIPIATALVPSPTTPILIAIAASFGIPFMISTPPNVMAYGEGGVKFADMFWPGIAIMIGGCVLIAATGRPVLSLVGIE